MPPLTLRVTTGADLSDGELKRILTLCREAYDEDLSPFFQGIKDPVHVLGLLGDELVSHALWITRWLQAGTEPPLRTAYVEAVATAPGHQRQGHASTILRHLIATLPPMDLAALCPSDQGHQLYQRLGWESWRGPLFIRQTGMLLPTPEESIMILRLPGTPPLDSNASLSAEWREGELW